MLERSTGGSSRKFWTRKKQWVTEMSSIGSEILFKTNSQRTLKWPLEPTYRFESANHCRFCFYLHYNTSVICVHIYQNTFWTFWVRMFQVSLKILSQSTEINGNQYWSCLYYLEGLHFQERHSWFAKLTIWTLGGKSKDLEKKIQYLTLTKLQWKLTSICIHQV